MNASSKAAFYYHADANAFGGVLKQPLERIISSRASVSLAQAGGFSASRHEGFDLDGLISVRKATARVSGMEDKELGGWTSTAAATIEGLNAFDIVTADRIVSQISVTHPHDNRSVQVSFLGSQFVNLRVNGVEVQTKPDPRFFDLDQNLELYGRGANPLPRFAKLLRGAQDQRQGRVSIWETLKKLGHRFDFADFTTDLDNAGGAPCSLVQEVHTEAPVESLGYVLHLPGFGNIFLGELLVSGFSVQLTMLRLEMGCQANGDVSFGSTSSNGRTMP